MAAPSVKHKKQNVIQPDWTQADVDKMIALGYLVPGSTPSNIILTSDWKADHDISGLQASLVAGTNITIDNTDPNNPVISATGTGSGVTSVTGTAPIVSSGGTTPAISIPKATGSVDGYLAATDFAAFNAKQPAGAYITYTSLSGTAPITYNNTTGAIGITKATTSTDGYLTSTDWNAFNSKQPAGSYVTAVSVTSANGVSGTSSGGTTPALTISLGAITPSSVAATGTVTGSNLSGTNTGNVTIGTANGLSLAGQALSLTTANTSTTGALTFTDWNTFNSKQGAITLTTTGTSGAATLVGNTLNIPNYATGSGTVTSVSVVSANGFAGTVANPSTTPAITLSTTITGLLKGNGTTISAATAGTDYVVPSGNVATATALQTGRTISITGDLTYTSPSFDGTSNITATGTLATVNANVGTFGSASNVAQVTVNAKGLTTAASNVPIQIAESQVTNLTTDLAAKQNTVSLTTTGTSGAATFNSTTGALNIPNYATGGSGTTNNFDNIQVDQAGGTVGSYGTLSGLINGSNTVFTVSNGSYVAGSLLVYENGQLIDHSGFSETTPGSGTFTFGTAPATGKIINAVYNKISTGSTNLTLTAFTATSSQTVTATTATSIIPTTGKGSMTIPANYLTAGRQLVLKGRGVYSTVVVAPTLAVTIKYGTTTIATGTVTALLNSATNLGFSFEMLITCRTPGAAGTSVLFADGSLPFQSGTGMAISALYLNNGTSSVSADTTTSALLDVLVAWSSTGNSATVNQVSLEVLN